MSTIEQIEAAILKLPASDYQKLVQWLLYLDYQRWSKQRWSKQIEQDIISGKLDTLAQEALILKLPASDYQKLLQWLLDLDYQRWSEQLEQDIIGGKLDTLAQEALADFEAGQYRAI